MTKLNASKTRQVLYVKDIVKTPAWLAIKEIIKDYVYENAGTNVSPDVLLGMKQAIKEVENLVKIYEEECL